MIQLKSIILDMRWTVMDKYKINQIMATFAVAFFVLSVALCVTVRDKKLFNTCYGDYKMRNEGISEGMFYQVEAELYHDSLSDDFKSLFKSDYDLVNYELLDSNVEKLNHLKAYYRVAWFVALLSLVTGIYSFRLLSKRRLYAPFLYGGVLAALLTSINAVRFFFCNSGILFELKKMILYQDYSYFDEGDILLKLIPPKYAGALGEYYLGQVFIWIFVMVIIRKTIINAGKPHKY